MDPSATPQDDMVREVAKATDSNVSGRNQDRN